MSKSKTSKSAISNKNNVTDSQPDIGSGTFYIVVNEDFELTLNPANDLPFSTLADAKKTAEEWMKDVTEEVESVEIVQVVAVGKVSHGISWSK